MMFKQPDPPMRDRSRFYAGNPMLLAPDGADLPVIETEVSIAPGNNKLGTVAEARAKRLLNRLQKGEPLAMAANAERMSVAELKDPDNPVRASVQQLIGSHFLPPEARKAMVRAGLNKLFLDNVSSADPADKKIALDAAKVIASDVEVGINTDNTGGVVINIGELADVFRQLATTPAPEISDGRPVLEAEFKELDDNDSTN